MTNILPSGMLSEMSLKPTVRPVFSRIASLLSPASIKGRARVGEGPNTLVMDSIRIFSEVLFIGVSILGLGCVFRTSFAECLGETVQDDGQSYDGDPSLHSGSKIKALDAQEDLFPETACTNHGRDDDHG